MKIEKLIIKSNININIGICLQIEMARYKIEKEYIFSTKSYQEIT